MEVTMNTEAETKTEKSELRRWKLTEVLVTLMKTAELNDPEREWLGQKVGELYASTPVQPVEPVQSVVEKSATKTSKLKSNPDLSSNQYAKGAAQIKSAIHTIQRTDISRTSWPAEEIYEALAKRADIVELFRFGDKERRMEQLNRVKSKYAPFFGGLREYPGVFLTLKPLPKRRKADLTVVAG
jgi:hypothetical protein